MALILPDVSRLGERAPLLLVVILGSLPFGSAAASQDIIVHMAEAWFPTRGREKRRWRTQACCP